MTTKFKEIAVGKTFRFNKIKKDYMLLKTSENSWKVIRSNCKLYKVGQSVVCDSEKSKILDSLNVTLVYQ